MESGAREYAGIEKLLETEPFIICPVHGDSMYPFINEDRDFVRLEKPHGVLAPYDLPLYRRPSGKLVLHRIIEVHRGYYVICGDNRSFRENVPYDWVVAVSTGVIRDGRYIAADSEEYKQYLEENVVGVVPETRRVRRKILNEWYTVLSLCSALLGRGRSKIYEDCYPPRLMQILRKLSLASALAPCFPETVSEKLGREVQLAPRRNGGSQSGGASHTCSACRSGHFARISRSLACRFAFGWRLRRCRTRVGACVGIRCRASRDGHALARI